MGRNASVDREAVDDCIFGCANQAGEDNRNVARMSLLLAGLPPVVPGSTVNRLRGSGLDAVGTAARAIRAGDAALMLAGGVESMTRAPFVIGKSAEAFSRQATVEDTTIGWRFVNPLMKAQYGVDSMPQTAENVAEQYQVSRQDQDAFAFRSPKRAKQAQDGDGRHPRILRNLGRADLLILDDWGWSRSTPPHVMISLKSSKSATAAAQR